ncbi:MAG: iron ABC transporter permease [Bacteroidetes bacterium]|nr:iron ABC transporter permease [Bacteroidota bacterium]
MQLFIGSVRIPISSVLTILTGGTVDNEAWSNIVIESRLPGALAAMLAGAGLSVSGLQMQTLFRNPVAGPYVLGISAGASLGVALYLMGAAALSSYSLFHLLSGWGIIISASLGAFVIFVVSSVLTFRIRDVVAVLIIGLMLGGGISAFIEILQSFSGNEALKHYVLWTFGSFRYVDITQVAYLAGAVMIGIFLSLAVSKQLNLLLLGEIYAAGLGVPINLIKYLVVFCTSLLAGCVTAFCGPIGFVGLAVPHIVRRLFNTYNHNILTPACALMGAVICCLCNILASVPGTEIALPINAVTSLFGAPVVIWIIMKYKKG